MPSTELLDQWLDRYYDSQAEDGYYTEYAPIDANFDDWEEMNFEADDALAMDLETARRDIAYGK